MSFLGDIASFSTGSLKKVDTRVRRQDGTRVVESRDESGSFAVVTNEPVQESGAMEYGFVPDYEPDLQIVQVRPYLYMCKFFFVCEKKRKIPFR